MQHIVNYRLRSNFPCLGVITLKAVTLLIRFHLRFLGKLITADTPRVNLCGGNIKLDVIEIRSLLALYVEYMS